MLDFEKLGTFYLGKRLDAGADALTGEFVLYDAKDLTTHAVIIGMTGSGKTGLGIGLLEEAALDHVPVIAIDPKGDLGNLLLTFPALQGADFLPWINPHSAADAGRTPEQYADDQAAAWRKGLEGWGQDGERIATLKNGSEFAIYTPGSTAGLPVSVLRGFAAPDKALDDADLYRERVQATATGLLSLIGLDADPVTSREHILVAQLLDRAWQDGRELDIAGLIGEIQAPPITKVGVLAMDTFFPPKDRHALAMQLNNLLAAPGFDVWMQGTPLDIKRFLYSEDGKPRVSVMSIAHLDDRMRMFFVTMLLNELVAWMRAQAGTSSLRAVLYMDEIFGYLPPVANPPCKSLFLTLLKQARAYGLGLVLATQNPVDLDYKALSNAGTWFVGRLQTERDMARVMDGLAGAGGAKFDRQAMERTLAGLGKRRFLLHNVHEDEPAVFETRWAMSYLAGPLTRDQIRALTPAATPAADVKTPASKTAASPASSAPALPPGVPQYFLRAKAQGKVPGLVYHAHLLGVADVFFDSASYKVHERRSTAYSVEFAEGAIGVDWDESQRIALDAADLRESGDGEAQYADCPTAAADVKAYAGWQKAFAQWLRQNEVLTLHRSKRLGIMSAPGETDGDFRVRLQDAAREQRDAKVDELRKRYAAKATSIDDRMLRARQALERQEQQSSKKKLDAVVSAGNAVLGALLGRKKLSSTTAGRIGSAIRTAGGASKESADVDRAAEAVAKIETDLQALNAELEREIAALDAVVDMHAEELEQLEIRAKSTDIAIPAFGLAWLPYAPGPDGRLQPAW